MDKKRGTTVRVGLILSDPAKSMTIAAKLAGHPDLVVTAIANSLLDAVSALNGGDMDVVVCGDEFMEMATRLRGSARPVKKLFLTDRLTVGGVVHGVHTGFDNSLVLNQSVDSWHDTIRRTLDGTSSLRSDPVWHVAGPPMDMTRLHFEDRPEIEKDIVELLAEGLTNDQIADILHLSSQTVRNKICRLMDDIGVHNRTLLSLAFRRSRVEWRQYEV